MARRPAPSRSHRPSGRAARRRRRVRTAALLVAAVILVAAVTLGVLLLRQRGGPPSPSPVAQTAAPTFTATATAAASPTATTEPSASATPQTPGTIATAQRLFGPGQNGVSCGSQHGTYAADCPVTPRFGARLQQMYAERPPYEPLCRCTRPWSSLELADAGAVSGGRDAVKVTFHFGATASSMLLVEQQQPDGGWLADDTWCGTDSQTSVYGGAPPACSS